MEHSYITKDEKDVPVYCRACQSYDCTQGAIHELRTRMDELMAFCRQMKSGSVAK